MKKSSLTTAVVAGLAGAAGLVSVSNAVNVNPDGLGQVLLYPYYTINNGQTTLISVVNTTNEVKAVKVRFVESLNSAEVLDFNLYLSPFDVWAAAVIDAGAPADSGGGAILVADRSCTVPNSIAGTATGASQTNFVNFQYASFTPDGGPTNLDRTRAGHLEMIEMGNVTNAALRAAAIHAQPSGVPANCAALENAFRPGGLWASDPEVGVTTPNGGLFGGGEIVNVANGTNLSYNATALEGFFTVAGDNLHRRPESVDPSLQDVNNGGGNAIARVFDQGTVIDLGFLAGEPDAVSAALMHNEIYNEFNSQASLNAASEWVITFPTKRAHTLNTTTVPARRPFTTRYTGAAPSTAVCEQVALTFWNREERTPGTTTGTTNICPSPPPPGGCNPEQPQAATLLCYEANVFTFNQAARRGTGASPSMPSAVLGAREYTNFDTAAQFDASGFPVPSAGIFESGWARISLVQRTNNVATDHYLVDGTNDGDGTELIEGLPTIGFWAANYVNGTLGGGSTLANYSGLHNHRGDRNGYGVVVDPTTGTITRTGFAWS